MTRTFKYPSRNNIQEILYFYKEINKRANLLLQFYFEHYTNYPSVNRESVNFSHVKGKCKRQAERAYTWICPKKTKVRED